MESLLRDKRIALNIQWSAVMRGASIGINLLMVPLLLGFLGEAQYGVWLTISSFLGWSALLDLGVGNGLKNKLSEAFAAERFSDFKIYSSSAYIIISSIAVLAFLIFTGATLLLDWQAILNTTALSSGALQSILVLFFLFFCVKLILNQVLNISAAMQNTSLSDKVNFLINAGLLIGVLCLSEVSNEGLLAITLVFGLVPMLVLMGTSYWAFSGVYKEFRPSFKSVDWTKSKEVLGLGGQFFVIQIAGIVLFSTDNLIISHFIDPTAVTAYHIAFRYFGILITFFSILCTPIWPAFTEAYAKQDISWIKKTISKLIKFWLATVLLALVLLLISPTVYSLWVGPEVLIPWHLSAMMGVYVISLTWGAIFVTFINSIGALRIQLIFSIVAGLVNIPLSIWIVNNTSLGAAGVMLATIICLSYGPIVSVIQYKKIINGTAKGIWLK